MTLTLTTAELRELLDYSPDTGVFIWRRVSKHRPALLGTVAGHLHKEGYVKIFVRGRIRYAHRLAWLHHYGNWPDGQLDHIDRNRSNNAIGNLRLASNSQNQANCVRRGALPKGVRWRVDCRLQFSAEIKVSGRKFHLGRFATPEAAHNAYMAAAREHFGEYARAA